MSMLSQGYHNLKHILEIAQTATDPKIKLQARANNNRVERLNGTLRERVKVQRGWKSNKSAIAERPRIQYNFVKPHMALNGETPAKRVGVEMKGKTSG